MKSIFKYPLNENFTEIQMPENATLLHVADQMGILQLWALVDTEESTEVRQFRVFLTGQTGIDDDAEYLATVITDKGKYVQHVFEVVE